MEGRGMLGIAIAVWIAAGASGCIDSTGPTSDRRFRVGVLQMEGVEMLTNLAFDGTVADPRNVQWDRDPADALVPSTVIESPELVDVGEAFEIRVYTIGESGCWATQGHVIHQSEWTVEITPYDMHSGAEICTSVLSLLRHQMTLRMDEPGAWTLRVTGRRARYRDYEWEIPVHAEATVEVR